MSNELSERSGVRGRGVLPIQGNSEFPSLRRLSPLRPLLPLRWKDPALYAMTDFTRTMPISVTPEQPIDEALEQMRLRGVRYLLVVAETQVVGSITSYDIEGGRRLNFLQRSAGTRLGPICVGDIMTEWEDLPTMDWPTVQAVRVADLVEIFRGVNVMHLLVVEEEVCRDGTLVRGLISRTRVDKRLDRGGQASDASRGAQGVRD